MVSKGWKFQLKKKVFAICFDYFHMWHLKAHYKHQVSVSTDSLSKIQGRLLNCKGFFEGPQWQNARLPPRCDLSPLKTENGVERIRRCDLLWKPRTISIVCAFLLFLHLPCRDKRAQHAGNCEGNYNPAVLPSLISYMRNFRASSWTSHYPGNIHRPPLPSLRCQPNRRQQQNQRQSSGCRISARSRFQASLALRRQQLGRRLAPLKIAKDDDLQKSTVTSTNFHIEVKANWSCPCLPGNKKTQCQ